MLWGYGIVAKPKKRVRKSAVVKPKKVCKLVMRFVPFKFDKGENPNEILDKPYVRQVVLASLKGKIQYKTFAEVPITPRTIVFRVDDAGKGPQMVCEVAYSKHFKGGPGYESFWCYFSSFWRKGRMSEFRLALDPVKFR